MRTLKTVTRIQLQVLRFWHILAFWSYFWYRFVTAQVIVHALLLGEVDKEWW